MNIYQAVVILQRTKDDEVVKKTVTITADSAIDALSDFEYLFRASDCYLYTLKHFKCIK